MQIHGISGWSSEGKKVYALLAKMVDPKAGVVLPPELRKEILTVLDIPDPEVQVGPQPDLSTPEARLEELKKAAAEGRIEIAPPEYGGFIVQWSEEGVGFGELTVAMMENGEIKIDDECMRRESLLKILKAVLDQGVTWSEEREKKGKN